MQLRKKLLNSVTKEVDGKEEKINKDAARVCNCGCGKTLKPATIKLHMKKASQASQASQADVAEEKELDRSIVDHTKHGLEIGIENGLNIIYDTTLKERDIIKEDIIPLIRAHNKKYKILVLLITADSEAIKDRLRGRHHAMIGENYVRAIKLELVEKFIELNKKSYDKAHKYYTEHATDFKDIVFDFKEKDNPPRSPRRTRGKIHVNKTRKRSHNPSPKSRIAM